MKKSGLVFIGAASHNLMCPVHGIIPNATRLIAGTGAGLTEYKIFKPFEYIHNKQVELISEGLYLFDPKEEHHHNHENPIVESYGFTSLESVIEHNHENCSHEDVHQHAEITATGLNLAVMAYSGYLFYKSWKKRKEHKH